MSLQAITRLGTVGAGGRGRALRRTPEVCLGLPDAVLEKVYHTNAERILNPSTPGLTRK